MNILAIQGSPRLGGNTQVVLDAVLSSAAESGAVVKTAQISELECLSGCGECYECQECLETPGCTVQDEMTPVVMSAVESDLIILATPVYQSSPSVHLQFAMDRFYCLFKTGDGGDVHSLLAGKAMAAVITSAGSEGEGAADVAEVCRQISDFSQARWKGAFLATGLGDPSVTAEDQSLALRAVEFGHQLVDTLRVAS